MPRVLPRWTGLPPGGHTEQARPRQGGGCIGKQDETQVRASMKEADSLQVEGAPALFVDGARISGALPQEQVWAVIDRALRDAGVEPPAAPAQSLPSPPAGIGK